MNKCGVKLRIEGRVYEAVAVTHQALGAEVLVVFMLLGSGSGVSSGLVPVVPSSLRGARGSVLPADEHVQGDSSQVILVHAFHVEAVDLKEESEKSAQQTSSQIFGFFFRRKKSRVIGPTQRPR